MKNLVLAFALVLSTTAAQAYTCNQLISQQESLAQELNSLRSKIRAARNSDKIEFYMDQYEEVHALYQDVTKTIQNNCR